jgi:hypothetical protein
MAKIAKKGRGMGFRLPKKWMKYLILMVGGIMLFSGLYVGLGREMPQGNAKDDTSSWMVVSYDSAQIGDTTALTKIIAQTGQYKLRPNQMSSLNQQDINDIFQSNITGVKSIVFENAPREEMFNIDTDGTDVVGEFRRRVRIPGGYEFLPVYQGSTPYGQVDVVGDGLSIGDSARVLLMQRTRGTITETLAFVQKRIPAGPILNVTVANVTNIYVEGTITTKITESQVNSQIKDSVVAIDGTTVTAYLPLDADVNAAKRTLEAMNVTSISVGRTGFIAAPDEMLVGENSVVIPNNNRVATRLKVGAKANDKVEVMISMSSQGNRTSAKAVQM